MDPPLKVNAQTGDVEAGRHPDSQRGLDAFQDCATIHAVGKEPIGAAAAARALDEVAAVDVETKAPCYSSCAILCLQAVDVPVMHGD